MRLDTRALQHRAALDAHAVLDDDVGAQDHVGADAAVGTDFDGRVLKTKRKELILKLPSHLWKCIRVM